MDVVAENLRDGAMRRLGLEATALLAVEPSLIYLSISGFGKVKPGPYSKWPAYAPIAEAMAGFMEATRPEGECSTPGFGAVLW